MTLQKQSIGILEKINEQGEISIYQGELTREHIMATSVKVLAAFRELDTNFINLLTEAAIRNNFTNERFTDAVNHVIDNCIYPKPSIANFINYDKKYKLYRHSEVVELGINFDDLVSVDVGIEKPMWIYKSDFKNTNLELWKTSKS